LDTLSSFVMGAIERVFASPDLMVYLAGAMFILGYLTINQVALRLLILLGTAFYIAYYASAATEPLWSAIYLSLAQGLATFIGMMILLGQRSRWAIPARMRDLYPQFAHLPPGDFATLMRHAKRYVVEEDTAVTHEGGPSQNVVYIISGYAQVTKRGESFRLPPGVFIGEVAYLLGRPSAATNVLMPGAEVLRWSKRDLDRACARSPRFRVILEAALARDMAAKVAMAVAPRDLRSLRAKEEGLKAPGARDDAKPAVSQRA
jgi:CRP-like cAMP-binding protein